MTTGRLLTHLLCKPLTRQQLVAEVILGHTSKALMVGVCVVQYRALCLTIPLPSSALWQQLLYSSLTFWGCCGAMVPSFARCPITRQYAVAP